MIIFYRDESNTFKCDIKIEGASLNQSKARLLLRFEDRAYVYDGTIDSGGHCEIEIAKLQEDATTGNATLEVIAENTFFEPWKASFELRNKKSVHLEQVSVNEERKLKKVVVVESVQVGSDDDLFVVECSLTNRKLVNTILEKYHILSEQNLRKVLDQLKEYKPSKEHMTWARTVFINPVCTEARYCMRSLSLVNRKNRS